MVISANIDDLLRNGIQHHTAGRLPEAEAIYRQALALQPNHPEAMRLLAELASSANQPQMAIDIINQALRTYPNYAEAYLTLGNALGALQREDQCIAAFRRAIELKPDYAGAYNNLANALNRKTNYGEAIAACRKALAFKPDFPEAYNNLGNALLHAGQHAQAIDAFNAAINISPGFAAAYFNMGMALMALKRTDQGIEAYRRAIACNPKFAEAYFNLAAILRETGRLNDAINMYQQALNAKPDWIDAWRQLALTLERCGRYDETIAAYQRLLAIDPKQGVVHNDLGKILKEQRRVEESVVSFQRFVELSPRDPLAHNNLGTALAELGRADDAMACYREAIRLDPNYPWAYTNLANSYKDKSMFDESVAAYRETMRLVKSPMVHSKLVYLLYFHPGYDSRGIDKECRYWDELHGLPWRSSIPAHRNNRDPNRKLRIGYVSPDFTGHVIGRNMLPLIREHDPNAVEVFCYCDAYRPDMFTHQFRACRVNWRDTPAFTDDELIQQIMRDEIDILLDLTLHMARNRLTLFVRKPAPVQVTFAGYPGGTGLSAIDYRLTDPYLDPPGVSDKDYVETSVRLPDSFWCYDPTAMMLDVPKDVTVTPLPADANGYVTFCCFNNFSKVNDSTIDLWARVMNAVPDSRLHIMAPEGDHRSRVLNRLNSQGIDSSRVKFVGFRPRADYLKLYQEADLGLDTLPYNGHTTSLDSYWMGVPVVTLVGNTVVGRAGFSQLSNLGLTDLITNTSEQYIDKIRELANDRPRLRELRATMRDRMLKSPLTDAKRFARGIEQAYREMWKKWCAGEIRPTPGQ